MGRYTKPLCRLCRREGEKLFLKGTRCNTDKCALARRQQVPGMHGAQRQKISNYGVQMREKQKVKRLYGLYERQFKNYYFRATKMKGITGAMLLQLLEQRLDNVIFRLRFARSRQEARQMVRHGHVHLNGRKVSIPSFSVKVGDKLVWKGREKATKQVHDNLEMTQERIVPPWLRLDQKELAGEILSLPRREDVGFPIREQLIVELYSK